MLSKKQYIKSPFNEEGNKNGFIIKDKTGNKKMYFDTEIEEYNLNKNDEKGVYTKVWISTKYTFNTMGIDKNNSQIPLVIGKNIPLIIEEYRDNKKTSIIFAETINRKEKADSSYFSMADFKEISMNDLIGVKSPREVDTISAENKNVHVDTVQYSKVYDTVSDEKKSSKNPKRKTSVKKVASNKPKKIGIKRN
jgi:hypothetical protein